MSIPSAAPICGFDIGTENCYIGVARQGGIEIILNDYSQRSTPGYVCLQEKQRELGVTAKQKQNTNINNTFYNLRRLIGRQYHEVVKDEQVPFPIEEGENGGVTVRVFIHGEEHQLTATQLLAMVLSKLKQISNNALECVLNCPAYFTDNQRRELKNAATIASINTLKVLPDLSAVALYYCFYRISSKEENNQILAFIDIGASSTQCSIVNFEPKKNAIQVLAVEYESNLGGRNFDQAIADYFIEQQKLGLNKRSKIRLLAECEKLKKQMSANSNELPIGIECLHDDRDFSARMSRETFEQLCESHFERVGCVLQRAKESAIAKYAQLQKDSGDKISELALTTVEIVGGSSRIPAIKRIVKNIFNIEPKSTLNADEAVALGCTLQSAFLSPSFKVLRKLKVIDYQPYQINAQYYHETRPDIKVYTMSPFFQKGSAIPFAKEIILTCQALPIVLEFDYINEANQPTSIGQFRIFSKENLQFTTSKMKVRIRLDDNGLIQLATAHLKLEDNTIDASNDETAADNAEVDSADQENKEAKQTKKKIKNIELDFETVWLRGYLNDNQLDQLKNFESQLVLADKNLNERIDSRNALEEYIYDWRNKIETSEYQKFIDHQLKEQFSNELKENQKWLMDDEDSDEIQSKTVYQDRLNNLRSKYSNAILFRIRESENRSPFLEQLGRSIQMGYKLLENEEQVDGIDKLKEQLVGAQQWFDDTHSKLSNLDLTQNPPILVSSIQSKTDELNNAYKQIYERIQKLRHEREEQEKKAKQQQTEKMETNDLNQNGNTTSTNEEISKESMDVEN
jgi:molecular chaperone DnaK (HSP70)